MKATTWLCPILILLCATKLVCTAQGGSYGGYPLENENSQTVEDDFCLSKRNKPSLSIVNPLDVLRQRLLLEIARRQMKENTRQVELNRAILKHVGKRMASRYTSPLTAALYDVHELQQRQQQEPVQHLQPYEYELIPTALIFDYLQQQQRQKQQRRPWLPYDSTAIQFDNNYINDAIEESLSNASDGDDAETGRENIQQDIFAFNGNNGKHSMKHMKQTNNEYSTTSPNGEKSISNRDDDTKRYTQINSHQLYHRKNDLDLNDSNPVSAKPKANANDYKNELTNNGGDYQIQRYLYHLHKNQNHLTRK